MQVYPTKEDQELIKEALFTRIHAKNLSIRQQFGADYYYKYSSFLNDLGVDFLG